MMKIETIGLSKSFKNVEVISNVNLTFESGKIYGLYGRNGAGKSVFLKLICGFFVPTKGNVLFNGIDYNERLKYPPNLRALIEKPSFFSDLSGLDNLRVLAKIQRKITDKEILQALKTVNLTEEKDKKYREYSLGMKQKLGIAQVIMEDPEILILDEPFNGIEHKTVLKLIEYLKEEKKRGKLIIISTHIKGDLLSLADEVYYFDAGKVVTKEELDDSDD
ncbi:MAG: ABC transporter ATP-binding protein [Bacilli bacterium]|nr:ABC transporter ATP-binding protein [Bacilli bacterium]